MVLNIFIDKDNGTSSRALVIFFSDYQNNNIP